MLLEKLFSGFGKSKNKKEEKELIDLLDEA